MSSIKRLRIPLSKEADAARKREERGAEARAQEKLALQSEAKPVARELSTRIAEVQAQAVAKQTHQAEEQPAKRNNAKCMRLKREAERHQPRGVDACCAKVMNEFVKLSGKPPTLRDIRQVIMPKVNVERQLQNKPPILESTLVTHI